MPADGLPSLDVLLRVDALLDGLAGTPPETRATSREELAAWMLAAQLPSAIGDSEPRPAFLAALERQVLAALPQPHPARRRLSRRGFLRGAAALAGAAGGGVAAGTLLEATGGRDRPEHLVPPGTGRWYDVAAADELPPGASRRFTAGGVVGYLLNEGGTLRAVSGICTHMGCRLRPSDDLAGSVELRCLCHGSRFDAAGRVLEGLAPSPLPAIELRVADGRVYAHGTTEDL